MAREIALSHHEKWDGSGYPNGLKGEEIPLSGRLVAIADVFDALTTERPYRKAWSVEDAVKHIDENAGSHFDPNLVSLFHTVLAEILDIREQYAEPTV
jgi:putative two-component system response regulator